MHYTSGTTGKPKGVKRPLADLDPDVSAELFTFLLQLFGIQPGTPRGAPEHVAELPHRGHDVRGQRAAHEAHRRVHGQVGRGGDAAAHRALPLLAHAHGPDAVHPHAAAARRGQAEVRRVLDEVGDPRGRAVPRRHEAQDARLVGPGDLGVLRRDRRRRHDRTARRVAEVPGHGRPRVAELGAEDHRRRRQRRWPPASPAPCGCAWATGRTFEYKGDDDEDRQVARRRGLLHRRRRRLPQRGRATCSSATARAT